MELAAVGKLAGGHDGGMDPSKQVLQALLRPNDAARPLRNLHHPQLEGFIRGPRKSFTEKNASVAVSPWSPRTGDLRYKEEHIGEVEKVAIRPRWTSNGLGMKTDRDVEGVDGQHHGGDEGYQYRSIHTNFDHGKYETLFGDDGFGKPKEFPFPPTPPGLDPSRDDASLSEFHSVMGIPDEEEEELNDITPHSGIGWWKNLLLSPMKRLTQDFKGKKASNHGGNQGDGEQNEGDKAMDPNELADLALRKKKKRKLPQRDIRGPMPSIRKDLPFRKSSKENNQKASIKLAANPMANQKQDTLSSMLRTEATQIEDTNSEAKVQLVQEELKKLKAGTKDSKKALAQAVKELETKQTSSRRCLAAPRRPAWGVSSGREAVKTDVVSDGYSDSGDMFSLWLLAVLGDQAVTDSGTKLLDAQRQADISIAAQHQEAGSLKDQESVLPEGPAGNALQEMTKPKRIAITDSFWFELLKVQLPGLMKPGFFEAHYTEPTVLDALVRDAYFLQLARLLHYFRTSPSDAKPCSFSAVPP
eukprot:Skav235709  [mRNA]  locus=scaffold280:410716:417935:- [translate_table: standard]